MAVKPPFPSATTVIPPAAVTEDVLTVRGRFAASLQNARTPGVLIARYVAMLAVYVGVGTVQVMPVSATVDGPRLTVVERPEEQVVPVTLPLAQ
jgi:hypothetical protein